MYQQWGLRSLISRKAKQQDVSSFAPLWTRTLTKVRTGRVPLGVCNDTINGRAAHRSCIYLLGLAPHDCARSTPREAAIQQLATYFVDRGAQNDGTPARIYRRVYSDVHTAGRKRLVNNVFCSSLLDHLFLSTNSSAFSFRCRMMRTATIAKAMRRPTWNLW